MGTQVRPPPEALVGAAEAAFIADLDPKVLHRVVDETVLPDELLARRAESRQFVRLGAALAHFYFHTADALTRSARLEVIECAMERVRSAGRSAELLSLVGPLSAIDWSVRLGDLTVDLSNDIAKAAERAERARRALEHVVEDPDILGGLPTFRGTRVPIDVVLGAVTSGEAWERLQRSYAFLTPEHVDAANVYALIRPRRGRPTSNPEMKGWRVLSSRRLPPRRARASRF